MNKKFLRWAALATMFVVGVEAQNSSVPVDAKTSNPQIVGATAIHGQRFDSGIITIVTGGTTITSLTTAVQEIHCNTFGATASTVTIADGSGNVYWDALPLAAHTVTFEQFGAVGMLFSGGLVITAGTGSALKCQVVGVQ